MKTINFSEQAPINPTRQLLELLDQLGNQILLSSEKLPKKKLLDIFRCSADRVEILCEYTDDGFLKFYLDEFSDYRLFWDESIIGKIKVDSFPIKKVGSLLRSQAHKGTEIVMGNIFVIYPDAMVIKFLFHDPQVPNDEISSYRNTEICRRFSTNCTGDMNILRLYQTEILSNISYIKSLLEDFEKHILFFYNNLPRQKLANACNTFAGRVGIKCTYAKSGRFTFCVEEDESHYYRELIGRVEGKKGLTKEINAYLAKRYPGIKISNECIIYPDTQTIKFFFKFKTSLTESDFVHPVPSIVKHSDECTSKRKLLQNEFVWIFSADLIKMEKTDARLIERGNGEGETIFKYSDIIAFGIKTLEFETAEFKVELPLIDSLKI